MAQIPDMKNIPQEEFLDVLTRTLREINRDANNTVPPVIGKNVVFGWVDDGSTPLPQGYEIADGTKGTFDAKNSIILYIQKVK